MGEKRGKERLPETKDPTSNFLKEMRFCFGDISVFSLRFFPVILQFRWEKLAGWVGMSVRVRVRVLSPI